MKHLKIRPIDLLLCALFALASTLSTAAQGVYPGATWQTATASERSRWSNEKLADARKYSESIGSTAVMIIQGGKVIDQWGAVDKKLVCYSMRKSLLSAVYGIAVEQGKINPQATLAQLNIDDVPPLTPEEKQAKVVDLLRARSGVYHLVPFETAGMTASRPPRGSHPPGTFWYYNNWDFDTADAIFEKETGLSLGDAFAKEIAAPTQMQDFSAKDVFYLKGPESVIPGFMVSISARDLARFGLLYLDNGKWNGKQVEPADWVYKSSHTQEMVHAAGFDLGGYEYLWWVDYKGAGLPGVSLPDGTYSARGAGGHYLLIIPALDLIIVHRAANEPASWSVADVTRSSDTNGISARQFGALVKLIVSAYDATGQPTAAH
jgi:CubicO group peptidase (beta-lactamase class C family)